MSTNTPTTIDHESTCPFCWLEREWCFAVDEYGHPVPPELSAGVAAMLSEYSFLDDFYNAEHCDGIAAKYPDWAEAAADAAEFIASWRGTNDGPTRPRVVAYFNPLRPLMSRLAARGWDELKRTSDEQDDR